MRGTEYGEGHFLFRIGFFAAVSVLVPFYPVLLQVLSCVYTPYAAQHLSTAMMTDPAVSRAMHTHIQYHHSFARTQQAAREFVAAHKPRNRWQRRVLFAFLAGTDSWIDNSDIPNLCAYMLGKGYLRPTDDSPLTSEPEIVIHGASSASEATASPPSGAESE